MSLGTDEARPRERLGAGPQEDDRNLFQDTADLFAEACWNCKGPGPLFEKSCPDCHEELKQLEAQPEPEPEVEEPAQPQPDKPLGFQGTAEELAEILAQDYTLLELCSLRLDKVWRQYGAMPIGKASDAKKLGVQKLRGFKGTAEELADILKDRIGQGDLSATQPGMVAKEFTVELRFAQEAVEMANPPKVHEEPQAQPEAHQEPPQDRQDGAQPKVSFTRASDIKPRPVHWLWEGRIALGTLALLAGREGIGKSTIAYDLAARVTRGELEGCYKDEPKSVAVVATEDSWEHTIVPRLMGAGADLNRVLRVEVTTPQGSTTGIMLPRDLKGLEELIGSEQVALVLLDPLMSRLGSLDTHKDAEVRQALEPLVAVADRSGASILGLIHLNKSGGTDPLTLIMGSRAFTAVARAVLFAIKDSEDEAKRYLGQPKNNLGRTDLPTLGYTIQSVHVDDTPEGPVWTGRAVWGEVSERTIQDLLEDTGEVAEKRTAVSEAQDWLRDYLTSVGGTSASSKVKEEGRRYGHSADSLKRAKQKLKIKDESSGFPRQTFWSLLETKS